MKQSDQSFCRNGVYTRSQIEDLYDFGGQTSRAVAPKVVELFSVAEIGDLTDSFQILPINEDRQTSR